mgnify:FL=1
MRLNDLGGAADEISRAALAPILTFITAVARSMYYGRKRWPSRMMEGVLLALATVAIRPALVYVGMSDDMAVFFGVAMGFVGVDTLSDWIKRWGNSKIPGQG